MLSNIHQKEKPVPDRVEEYVRKVGNPFLVRVGEYAVKIGYSDCEETLNDRMKQYIKKLAEIKSIALSSRERPTSGSSLARGS